MARLDLVLQFRAMSIHELSDTDREQLLNDIATRAGTATEISKWYGVGKEELKHFVSQNHDELLARKEELDLAKLAAIDKPDGDVSVTELDSLWVSKKVERLRRYQIIADLLYKDIKSGSLAGSDLSTATREFRSYLSMVAQELGQLMNRGAGDMAGGDQLSIDFKGVDLDTLK